MNTLTKARLVEFLSNNSDPNAKIDGAGFKRIEIDGEWYLAGNLDVLAATGSEYTTYGEIPYGAYMRDGEIRYS